MKTIRKDAGVTFEYVNEEKYKKKNITLFDFGYRMFFLYLGVCGFVYSFLSAFSMKENYHIYALLFLPLCLYACYLFWIHNSIIIFRLKVASVLIMLLFGIICNSLLKSDLSNLVHQIETGKIENQFSSSVLLILYLSFFLSFLLAFLQSKRKYILSSIIIVIPAIIALIFGYSPSLQSMVILLMFLIGESVNGMELRIYCNQEELIQQHRQSQHKHSEYKHSQYKMGFIVACTIFILYLLIRFFYLETYFNHNRPFRGLSQGIISFWENTTQSGDKNKDLTASGGVNGGKLGEFDNVEFKDIPMLTLSTGYRGNIYLKGYIGSTYENNSWNEFSEEQKNLSRPMFDQFLAQGFDVYNLQNTFFSILENDENLIEQYCGKSNYINNVYRRSFSVLYQNASQNLWYIPYNSDLLLQDVFKQDYPVMNETGNISSMNFHTSRIDYDKLDQFIEQYNGDNQELNEYRDQEKIYRTYVYDNYTGVNADVLHNIRNTVTNLPHAEAYETTAEKLKFVNQLGNYFRQHFRYSLTPGKVPEDTDFVDYFLNETKQGYCTYFATAATMILRNEGIPARYVEGYKVYVNDQNCISSKLVDRLRKSKELNIKEQYKEYTVNVSDRNAHAWVEIYADGIGWIPIDLTPSSDNIADTEEPVTENEREAGNDAGNQPGNDEGNEPAEHMVEENQTDYSVIALDNSFAETEPYTEPVVVKPNDPESMALYRDQIFNDYHSLSEYMFQNKSGAIDFIVAGRLLEKDLIWLMIFLIKAMIVLLIVAILIYLPTRIQEYKRTKTLTYAEGRKKEEYEKQLFAIYAYIVHMGGYYKITRKEAVSYMKWAKQLSECRECFKKNDIEGIIATITKLTFSNCLLTQDEIKTVMTKAQQLRSDSYESLKKFEKIKYRFWFHLK